MGKSKAIIAVLVNLLFLLSSLYQSSSESFVGSAKSFHAAAQTFAVISDVEEQTELEETFKRHLFSQVFEFVSIAFPQASEPFFALYETQFKALVSQAISSPLPSRAPPIA